MNFDMIIFQGYTLGQIIFVAAGIVILLVIISILKKVFKKEAVSGQVETVTCKCGWQGHVSSLAGRCPKCNALLGSRKGR